MKSPSRWIPFAVFLVLFLQGAFIGLSDDEAYYWVLSQTPALGYAFHPPMVAWVIAAFEALLGWTRDHPQAWVVRLPAALISGLTVAIAMRWFLNVGVAESRLKRATVGLLSFAGVFGASWMIVPDLPMLMFWMMLFTLVWRLCHSLEDKISPWVWLGLVVASAGMLLSKFSGIIAIGSGGLALLFWAHPRKRWPAIAALVLGVALACVPILIWNSQNDWGALRYQFSERHGGGVLTPNWVRYLRFWLIQLIFAGPPLVISAFVWKSDKVSKYCALFAIPAALVFLVQPLFSDFKPHWSLVVWFPMALRLAVALANADDRFLTRMGGWQVRYGWTLAITALALTHIPLVHLLVSNPKYDVGNDMYGWDKLRVYLASAPAEIRDRPVIGSRYQTASQAAFSIGGLDRVSMVPRDQKSLNEWPRLGVTSHEGPGWSALLKPVLFVGDNRYDAPPEFYEATCALEAKLETFRVGKVARWINVWKCDPKNPVP